MELLLKEKERWKKAVEEIEKIQSVKVPNVIPFNVAIIFVKELEE